MGKVVHSFTANRWLASPRSTQKKSLYPQTLIATPPTTPARTT